MIFYLDASVVARVLLGEPNPLAEWDSIEEGISSRLMAAELGRLIDRLRLSGGIGDEEVVQLHQEVRKVVRSLELVEVTGQILAGASGPMPTVLGTLDAIHLVTAMEFRRARRAELVVATHDLQLARAARAANFEVVGA